jgi:predicted GIY-YIG superfamily endonuclease
MPQVRPRTRPPVASRSSKGDEMSPDQTAKWKALVLSSPLESGIYAVFNGKTVLYIGQAENIKARLTGHTLTKSFVAEEADCIRFIFEERAELRRAMERFMIHHWKPKLNREHFPVGTMRFHWVHYAGVTMEKLKGKTNA